MAEEIMAPILCIIGTQSSGTTLFTRILLNDPKYYAQNELPIKRIFLNAPTRQQIRKKLDVLFYQEG
jgi:hypothetical protein